LWEFVDPTKEAFVEIPLFVLICGNLLTPKRSICGNIPICAYLWEFVDPTNLCKDKSFFNKSLKNQGKTFTEQKYLGNFASLSIKF